MGYVYRAPGRTIFMMKYYRNGVAVRESSETDNERKAKKKLRERETDVERGLPVGPELGKIKIEDAAKDIQAEYADNGKKSADKLERMLRLHLLPAFRGWKMVDIATPDVRAYQRRRRARHCTVCPWFDEDGTSATVKTCPRCDRETERGASPATVNRETAALRRMFTLAVQGGKLLHQPHIPELEERNTRKGFFEVEQFDSVRAHLKPALQDVLTFAYVTGWRIPSEVLTLEWPQVDLTAHEVRLDPDASKNDEPRVFPLTPELHALLHRLKAARDARAQAGVITPWVFVRVRKDGQAKPIRAYRKAWRLACAAVGVPGRIPHDFRRTAVRNMVRRGVPERVAMQMTGHKTRSVFERYNIVSPGDLNDARGKLAGLGADHVAAEMGTPTGTPKRARAFGEKRSAK